MSNRVTLEHLSRLKLDPETELTEELALVPVPADLEDERHICSATCEHRASIQVHHAAIDQEAGIFMARMASAVELGAEECFRIRDVRLRLRLIFRYHGLQRAQRVVQFLSTYDEQCTYRETADGIGRVLDVETERWDLTRREQVVFEHDTTFVSDGDLRAWNLPWESLCLDLPWPMDLPTHRVDSAAFYLSTVLYYRLDQRPQCRHDHCRGLGDFFVKPPRRLRVLMS